MRLAFSVAAYLKPDVLVVDEVLSVGDAAFQKKCLGKIDDVARRGRTVLLVSHQMFAIRTLCQRALWFDGGRLIKDGPALEVVLACEKSLLNKSRANAAVIDRELQEVQDIPFYIRRIQICDSQTEATTNVTSYSQTMNLLIFLAGNRLISEYVLNLGFTRIPASSPVSEPRIYCTGFTSSEGTASVRIDVGPLF